MITIRQALIEATKQLKQAKIDSSALDADVLLSYLLKKHKAYLYTYPEKELTNKQKREYGQLIKKRAARMPTAYLTGHKDFYGLDFKVNKNVLIPRPFTESLVEQVIKEVGNKKIIIADIGTGSGCIAIALKKHLPQATVYATDISPKALVVAQKNAKKNQVKIKFLKGDLLKPIRDKKIDYLIANLPYLKASQIKDELKYEPRTSLIGSVNDIKKLLQQITKLKEKPTKIFLEIDRRQTKAIKESIKKLGLKAFLISAYVISKHGAPKK
ncbi:MAG: peptide chain release factor N(5)-glutamine methyltransferase [bacterium]